MLPLKNSPLRPQEITVALKFKKSEKYERGRGEGHVRLLPNQMWVHLGFRKALLKARGWKKGKVIGYVVSSCRIL